jgi:hypothetical protein
MNKLHFFDIFNLKNALCLGEYAKQRKKLEKSNYLWTKTLDRFER